jgi:hypothetical protein
LSPFEVKSLLITILSASEQTSKVVESKTNTGPFSMASYKMRTLQVHAYTAAEATSILKSSTTGMTLPSELTLSAQSGGYFAGNFATIEILRDGLSVTLPTIFGRGLNVVVIDSMDGSIVETAAFDTHVSSHESEEFAKMIEWLEPGMLVVVVAQVNLDSFSAMKAC